MRVSYNWLKQYIDLPVSAEELGRCFTAAGLELDEIEEMAGEISGVKVAKVLSCEDMLGSDHLHLCSVDVGEEAPLTIVCGAPNVHAGQIAACATVGAVLPGGFTISEKATLGVTSQGMLCSPKELGLGDDHSGNWDLTPFFPEGQAPLGEDIVSALDLYDQVLSVELTPNRSDCLGMLNCAREAAALVGGQVREPEISYPESGRPAAEDIAITIQDPDLCSRYVGRVVKNVTIGPSPLWMQNYLLAAGMRPINNVVDISNFVMLEMNQPLHTFDLSRVLDKQIVVRRAQVGETMTTLDGKERVFTGSELLITDGAEGRRPVCVAGVMGGMDTEVTGETRDILIESACFEPVSIRRTCRALGIPSEASQRFEKGVDAARCDIAARRACQLLVQYCGGQAGQGCVDARAPKFERGFLEKTVALRPQYVNEALGTDFSAEEIASIMRRLSFQVEELPVALLVKIPSYRQDISLEVDLIEEVARIAGFERIPRTLPVNAAQGGRSPEQKVLRRLKQLCAGAGLREAVNYSFISPADCDRLGLAPDHPWRQGLIVTNPLSEDQSVMRQTLLPGLLASAGRNLARRNLDVRLFEVGQVFIPDASQPQEVQPNEIPTLALLLAGSREGDWLTTGGEYDYFFIKGLVEAICHGLGGGRLTFSRAREEYLHPGRSAEVIMDGVRLGVLGEVHPQAAKAYGVSGRAYVAELALPALMMAALTAGNKSHELPRYPASTRDIAVIGSADTAASAVEALIREAGGPLLSRVRLFDLYDQAPIPQGQRSLAYALEFRSERGTLVDKEVDEAFAAIVTALDRTYGYKLR